jgi:opacity protein-like surface antigen
MNRVVYVCVLVVLMALSQPAAAQTAEQNFQVGVLFSSISSSEFDDTDVGAGGRISWRPAGLLGSGLLGADAEFTFYPSDFADEPAFSSNRVEGLFGVTVGPTLGRLRPFAKVRPGFVRFSEAPEPFPCILIFPPPLGCQLAGGATVFALDLGGGVEFQTSDRTSVRVDVGDRAVRYPAPVIDSEGTVRDDAFFSHDFRLQIGGAFEF